MPDPSYKVPAEGTHRKHPELRKKLKVTQPSKTQAEQVDLAAVLEMETALYCAPK